MGRKIKTTSMKVDDKIYNKIKELKNHHDIKEKSYQEFVNNALAEKIIEIKKAKLIDSIGDEGLFSYVARLDRVEKKIDGMLERNYAMRQNVLENAERQKLTDQAYIQGRDILEAIKNEDNEQYNKLIVKHDKLIKKIKSATTHIDKELTRLENTHKVEKLRTKSSTSS